MTAHGHLAKECHSREALNLGLSTSSGAIRLAPLILL